MPISGQVTVVVTGATLVGRAVLGPDDHAVVEHDGLRLEREAHRSWRLDRPGRDSLTGLTAREASILIDEWLTTRR